MATKPPEERIKDLVKAVGQEGQCRGCGRKIWWIVTKNGKKAPYTDEGLNHFADCPKANEFR